MPNNPTTPKRDPREATPGAEGLSSTEFEKMMEELEGGIKKTKKPKKPEPLSVKSALKAQEDSGITSSFTVYRSQACYEKEIK